MPGMDAFRVPVVCRGPSARARREDQAPVCGVRRALPAGPWHRASCLLAGGVCSLKCPRPFSLRQDAHPQGLVYLSRRL